MTVREFLGQVDSRDLAELEAIERIDGPIGSSRLDWLFAKLCEVIVNAQPFRSRGAKAAAAKDFLLKFDVEELTEPGEPIGQAEPEEDEEEERAAALWQKVVSIFSKF